MMPVSSKLVAYVVMIVFTKTAWYFLIILPLTALTALWAIASFVKLADYDDIVVYSSLLHAMDACVWLVNSLLHQSSFATHKGYDLDYITKGIFILMKKVGRYCSVFQQEFYLPKYCWNIRCYSSRTYNSTNMWCCSLLHW